MPYYVKVNTAGFPRLVDLIGLHIDLKPGMGRISRQQEFLKAATAQALTVRNLPKRAQQREAVVQGTVPGHGGYVDDISYYLVDHDPLSRLVSAWQPSPETSGG